MNAVRPAPGWEAPPGHVHEPMVAPDWRLVTGEKRCRMPAARQQIQARLRARLEGKS